ncbi:hypothetical protein [Roseibium sp.]|uniref:hypothetical protein n=1 Tax=Roseibium sp. TaxID=1936156 RepID=UPI00326AC714
MTATARYIPPFFYNDHVERDLPAPPILKVFRQRYLIDTDHPDFDELVDDARHYANDGTDADPVLARTARALLKALGKSA